MAARRSFSPAGARIGFDEVPFAPGVRPQNDGTGSPRAGDGCIGIPRLAIHAPLEAGTSFIALLKGVGHVEGTAWPGTNGNAVLAGHRDGYFRALEGVATGDSILVTTTNACFVYRVDATEVVEPDRVDVLESSGVPELTLITCYPFRYIGPAPQRFIVKARLASWTLLEDLVPPTPLRVARTTPSAEPSRAERDPDNPACALCQRVTARPRSPRTRARRRRA
jgi:LPXTG-site transpeptidase (sortase) family protein